MQNKVFVDGKTLREISRDLVTLMRRETAESLQAMLSMHDYHGFVKSRFPERLLGTILDPYGLKPTDVQIELVRVETDLTPEIHRHMEAHALTTIVGGKEHVDEPRSARAFKAGVWSSVVEGDEIDLPPGTPHTFTVDAGGLMYFLSVQAPPIEREDGRDDYFRVPETS